jgi:hypothetical protein
VLYHSYSTPAKAIIVINAIYPVLHPAVLIQKLGLYLYNRLNKHHGKERDDCWLIELKTSLALVFQPAKRAGHPALFT